MSKAIQQLYLRMIKTAPGVGPLCPQGLPMVFGPDPTRKSPNPGSYMMPNPKTGQPEPVVFPSMYWVMCPLVRSRISMIEATDGMSRMERRIAEDPAKTAALAAAHAAHREDFLARGGDPNLGAGVGGGNGRGIKCLHTHYAHYLATGENIVGELVAQMIANQPECQSPCVKCPGARKKYSSTNENNKDYDMNPDWTLPATDLFSKQNTEKTN